MKNKDIKKEGFTFIEIILYISIISIFISSLLNFGWNIIIIGKKNEIYREVFQNGFFALRKISEEIKNSKNIIEITQNSICLEKFEQNYNPTKIYFSNNKIYIGWGGSCSLTTNNYPLTSSLVNVSSLNFTNLSNNSSTNINFSITINSIDNNLRNEYKKTINFTSSSEIRSTQ